MHINYRKNTIIFFSFLVYLSYFLGFLFNENSIGSGGYDGDITWMWRNFELFKNNNLIEAINHEDFFGSRTPLLYIINIFLNPFVGDIYLFRLSIFFLSLLGPLFFFLCLKERFKDTDKELLLLISSIILLSPYFRSTAIWGLEINYGIITMLVSFYYIIKLENKNLKPNIYQILILVFFSSICVYFDQKLLFVPILALIKIFLLKKNLRIKITATLIYFLLAIPFIYLIIQWKGIVPPATQAANLGFATNTQSFNLDYQNIGYATTILGLYLFPIIFLLGDYSFKKFYYYFRKNFLFIAGFFLIYLFFFLYFDWYNLAQKLLPKSTEYLGGTYGLGFVNKLAFIFFTNSLLQKTFVFLSFFLSWIIVTIFFNNKIKNCLLISYFYLIALVITPLHQEHFDPYVLILALLCFDLKIKINFVNSVFIFLYFVSLLASAIIIRSF